MRRDSILKLTVFRSTFSVSIFKMPPKKKAKDKSSAKDKKTASKVDSWKTILEIAALNSSAWTCQVSCFVHSSDNDGEHLKEFAKKTANGSRTDVKCLTLAEILEAVKKIGMKGETTTENTVYLESFDYLKNNNSIPPNILALVVKSQLMGIKDLDLRMKKEKEELCENSGKVENAMMAPRFVKPQSYKESEKNSGTELRTRGEEWRDKEFIKDSPNDGPSVYIALVGFNDVNLTSECIKIGIAIKSIVMVNYEEQEEDSDDDRDFHDVEIEKFWRDIENIKGDVIFKDTCFIDVKLCDNEDVYDKIAFLMYDIQDVIRQHNNYLDHMRVIDLKDTNPSNIKNLFTKYKNKIDTMKVGYSIGIILDCMLFAVSDNDESAGQLTDPSVKVEIESENESVIKNIRDKFKPKMIKPFKMESYNSNEEMLDTFTPEPLLPKKIENIKNDFHSFLDRTPSASPLKFLKEAETLNYWEGRLPTPISLRDFFEFTLIDDYDWIKLEDKKYKEKCKSVSIISEVIPGATIDDDLILLDSIKYQLALIECKNKLMPTIKFTNPSPESESVKKTDSKKSKSPKGKKKEKKLSAKEEPEPTLKSKPVISVHSIGYNMPYSLVQFSGWKSSTQLADGSIVNVESNFNTIDKQRSLRLHLMINGHRIYFDQSHIRISTKNGIEMSFNHNNDFSASWPNGLMIGTVEDSPYCIQQILGDFQKKFTKTGEVIHFLKNELVDMLKLGHSIADLNSSTTVNKATDYQKGTITITKDSFKSVFTSDGCQSAAFPDGTCLTSRYLTGDKLLEGFVRIDMIYKAEHPNFCRVSTNTLNDILTLDMPDVSVEIGHNRSTVTFDEFTKLVIEGHNVLAYSKRNVFNVYTKDSPVYCDVTENGERIFTVNDDGTIEGSNACESHAAVVAEYEMNPTTWKMPITGCDKLEKTDKGSHFKWKDIFADGKNAAVAIPDTLESFKNKMRIIGIEKVRAETHRNLLKSGYIPPYFKNIEGSIWLWLTEIAYKAVPES